MLVKRLDSSWLILHVEGICAGTVQGHTSVKELT